MSQVHNQFKVFVGIPTADNSVGDLGKQIEQFVDDKQVAPKSIGVEYLEATKKLIMTLGYSDDQGHTPVTISCVSLGRVDIAQDTIALESKMSEVASQHQNLICHELYITDENEFFMVFMGLR